mmetsp:Transcript_1050/g.2320  ORF Transcript_1050/g.2320 Transcript_1050/m.2320 type:complete len:260 (-) Transcript_1050:65-844(-)
MMKPGCPETLAYLERENESNQDHPLVHAVANMLQIQVESNERAGPRPVLPQLQMFEGFEPAPISADAYVKRLMKYGGIAPSVLVMGALYLERLKKRVPLVLTTRNVQRLYLVAVMTAAKMWEDFYFSNMRWGEIGAISNKELNKLEIEFLNLLGFKLHITTEEYNGMQAQVMAWCPPAAKRRPVPLVNVNNNQFAESMNLNLNLNIGGGRDAAVGSRIPSPSDKMATLSSSSSPRSAGYSKKAKSITQRITSTFRKLRF